MPLRWPGRRPTGTRIDEYAQGYACGWSEGHSEGYAAGRRAALMGLEADIGELALVLEELSSSKEERPRTELSGFLPNLDWEVITQAHRLIRSE
jgi:hypothetical protein